MFRQPLLNLLRQHHPADAHERAMTNATIAFVEQHQDCFERSFYEGHITASALIVSSAGPAGAVIPDQQRVVLIHHRKLNRWLQPGGHADGNPDVAAVALLEAREETGLTRVRPVPNPNPLPAIFDVDVHPIPARADVPAHLHYDIRFLLEADPAEPFRANHETNDIRWLPIDVAAQLADSESVGRMLRKLASSNA